MAYVLLIIGIILIIYALKTTSKNKEIIIEDTVNIEVRDNGLFDSVFQSSEVLRRLDSISEKIDLLSTVIDSNQNSNYDLKRIEDLVHSHKTQLNITQEDMSNNNDINKKIKKLRNEGMGIEEIANEVGLMKGEVLLRLGMKK